MCNKRKLQGIRNPIPRANSKFINIKINSMRLDKRTHQRCPTCASNNRLYANQTAG